MSNKIDGVELEIGDRVLLLKQSNYDGYYVRLSNEDWLRYLQFLKLADKRWAISFSTWGK